MDFPTLQMPEHYIKRNEAFFIGLEKMKPLTFCYSKGENVLLDQILNRQRKLYIYETKGIIE